MPNFAPNALRLRAGNKLANTSYANEIASAVNSLNPGYVLGNPDAPISPVILFVAVVTDHGPNGEGDFDDERCWLKPQAIAGGGADAAIDIDATNGPTPFEVVSATDISGRLSTDSPGDGRRNVDKDDIVAVVGFPDTNGVIRYIAIGSSREKTFIGTVTAAASLAGDNGPWAYTFTESEKTGAAYSGWTAKSGGRAGTLYNLIEGSASADYYGNGIKISTLPSFLNLQPIPVGTPVEIKTIRRVDDGSTEYWCQYENAVNGSCDPPDEDDGGE